MLPAILGLLLPLVLGVVAGARSWFADPQRALDVLNLVALRASFPALVAVGLAGIDAGQAGWGSWVLVPLATLVLLAPLRLLRGVGVDPGSVGLVVVFGNTAYLGLPVVDALLGPRAAGPAALLVGVHVALAMTIGPLLLGSGQALGPRLGAVLRQPLVWSAPVGLGIGALPGPARDLCVGALAPLGRSAGPTALFLLGLYLWRERSRLARVDAAAWVHVLARGLWAPVATLPVLLALRAVGAIDAVTVEVALVLAAMPPAVTTFSIARELGGDEVRVAQAIVVGTVAALVGVPLVAAFAAAVASGALSPTGPG